MNQLTAIDAHLSSTRQREERTTNTQTPALIQYAETHPYALPPQWQFQEEGYRGIRWFRPSLSAVRDLAMAGHLARGTPIAASSSHEQPRQEWIESATVRVVLQTGGLA